MKEKVILRVALSELAVDTAKEKGWLNLVTAASACEDPAAYVFKELTFINEDVANIYLQGLNDGMGWLSDEPWYEMEIYRIKTTG